MSLTDVDLPALKLLMRRILEARHAGDRSEAFSLLRAQLLRHIDEDAARQPVRLYLDRLSRLPCGSEPWLDIFRALQKTLESHALPASA